MQIPVKPTSFLAASQVPDAVTDLSELVARVIPVWTISIPGRDAVDRVVRKFIQQEQNHNLILPGGGQSARSRGSSQSPEGKAHRAAPEGPSEAGPLQAGQCLSPWEAFVPTECGVQHLPAATTGPLSSAVLQLHPVQLGATQEEPKQP